MRPSYFPKALPWLLKWIAAGRMERVLEISDAMRALHKEAFLCWKEMLGPENFADLVRPVGQLEKMVRAVTLIPGTTEFGYETATVVQVVGPGKSVPENRHVGYAQSDVIASLDQLQAVCPNLERVAIVVAIAFAVSWKPFV